MGSCRVGARHADGRCRLAMESGQVQSGCRVTCTMLLLYSVSRLQIGNVKTYIRKEDR